MKTMEELGELDTDSLLAHRHQKFRKLGGFKEGDPVEPEKRRNMKEKEADLPRATAEIELEIENLRKKAKESKGTSSGPAISSEAIEKLRKEVDKEITNAFISMGLQDKLEAVKMELSKSSSTPKEYISPKLKEQIDKITHEFNQALSRPGSHLGLKQKLEMLAEVNRFMEQRAKGETLKREISEKLLGQVKEKMEVLRKGNEEVSKGSKLDKALVEEEVERAKEELKEMLTSVKADEVVRKEIERAVDMGGLREKINQLKEEKMRGSSKDRVEELKEEIREGILAIMDLMEVKKKVKIVVGSPEEAAVGADHIP